MWKTHCQLTLILDCSSCCQGWHNQLLSLGKNFFTLDQVGFDHVFPLIEINEMIILKKVNLKISLGYLCLV